MNEAQKKHFLYLLIGLYFCSAALTNLISLPFVNEKVQISELLFLPIFVLGYRYILESFRRATFKKWFLYLPFLYVIINLISSVVHGGLLSILESFGKVYLVILYWIILSVFQDFNESDLKAFLYKYATFTSVIVVFTCFVGFLFWYCGVPNLVGEPENYPYLGVVYRANGLTRTPGMLISVINICVPILVLKYATTKQKVDFFLLILMLVVAFFTFSKSNIFLWSNVVLFVLYSFLQKKNIENYQKRYNFFMLFVLGFVFFVFNIATHFLPISKKFEALEAFKAQYISDRIVAQTQDYDVYETCYLSTKRAAITVFQANPLLGVGTGNFDATLPQLKAEGLYPKDLPIYNPHCTFTGALAENGILGFVVLVLFLFILLKMAFANQQKSHLHFILFLCLFTMISEAFVSDTMNFRHYWCLFAIVVSTFLNIENSKKTTHLARPFPFL